VYFVSLVDCECSLTKIYKVMSHLRVNMAVVAGKMSSQLANSCGCNMLALKELLIYCVGGGGS
jgi:hypothetical protein